MVILKNYGKKMIKFNKIKDATTIDPDVANSLIPTHFSLQSELDQFEENNIASCIPWAFNYRFDILTLPFVKRLHLNMFNHTWKWAGKFRTTQTNLGIEAHDITVELQKLLDDTTYQIKQKSSDLVEIAVKLHHRMVVIHPFVNGNGRHSRIMADLLAKKLKVKAFTWGKDNLVNQSKVRNNYIKALKQADSGDIQPLIEFAYS